MALRLHDWSWPDEGFRNTVRLHLLFIYEEVTKCSHIVNMIFPASSACWSWLVSIKPMSEVIWFIGACAGGAVFLNPLMDNPVFYVVGE